MFDYSLNQLFKC